MFQNPAAGQRSVFPARPAEQEAGGQRGVLVQGHQQGRQRLQRPGSPPGRM